MPEPVFEIAPIIYLISMLCIIFLYTRYIGKKEKYYNERYDLAAQAYKSYIEIQKKTITMLNNEYTPVVLRLGPLDGKKIAVRRDCKEVCLPDNEKYLQLIGDLIINEPVSPMRAMPVVKYKYAYTVYELDGEKNEKDKDHANKSA